MFRKRPCRVCGRWYWPDPRVGERQCTCGREACRRERKKRTNKDWRRRNADYWRDGRLRSRVVKQGVVEPGEGHPTLGIDWGVVQAEIGLEAAIIIEESERVVVDWVQAEMRRQLIVNKGETGGQGGGGAQAQIASRSRSP
jgi:hypothetical protein